MRLYSLLWTLLYPLAALLAALHPRARGAWRGRVAPGAPPVEPGALWVHAASVGEGRAAEALFEALRAELGADRPVFLRTAWTDTGLATARGQDAVLPLPADHPALMLRWVARLRPLVLVLVESELWPGLLHACAALGVPVIVAGARPGAGTARLRERWPGLLPLGAVRAWLAVSATAAAGLRRWGLSGVEVVGDLKLDAPEVASALRFSRPTLVAGSTRPGDDAAVLAARPPDLQLVLAPRHRERFGEVAALLDASGLRWARRSALDGEVPPELEVLLLDSHGELAGCYGAAAVAFVGGTFSPEIGGHSPAEALARGVPVVHGPYISANEAAFLPERCVLAAAPGALGGAFAGARALGAAAPGAGEAAALAAQRVRALALSEPPPERPYRPALAPLAALWRARPRRRPTGENPVPVIAVGNLASGGTGKTQVVRWLAAALADRAPVVVSRGYGRRGGAGLRTPEESADAAWLGDELAMLHTAGFRVLSSPDRAAGVAEAARRGAGLVLLDDAMQQTQVRPDLLIAVADARHPRSGGVIPMGEAREGPEALERAQVLWLFGGEEPEVLRPHRRGVLVRAGLRPRAWVGETELPPDAFRGREALALAGIAHPGRFLEQLVGLGVRVRSWRAFPDHHRWSAAELAEIQAEARGHPILTTEKDRARLPPGFACFALAIEPTLLSGEAELRRALAKVLR